MYWAMMGRILHFIIIIIAKDSPQFILYLYREITKHSSALYIGMAKVLPIIDVLGYDG